MKRYSGTGGGAVGGTGSPDDTTTNKARDVSHYGADYDYSPLDGAASIMVVSRQATTDASTDASTDTSGGGGSAGGGMCGLALL
jgi:hypothetical protein